MSQTIVQQNQKILVRGGGVVVIETLRYLTPSLQPFDNFEIFFPSSEFVPFVPRKCGPLSPNAFALQK